jgi:murein DD-endopeptidase MepM/ murein hydrolase activator NlpD
LAKPFSIQAPENIAKEYGGNKQKIAQAAQMGIVDPTAAVLAGMFIDRMRSAQVMESAQQPTVAQQVLGGEPPAPPAGLGATPEAAAMPPMGPPPEMGAPPPMDAPQEMPMMAAGGMVPPYASGGGLSDVPVPDGMFDEPSNGGFGDGYAGGGIVAFAQGDEVVDPTDWMRSPVTSKYGVQRSTGAHQGMDFGVGNKTPIGVPAPGKIIKAATDNINGNFVIVEHPDGTRSSYSHLSEFNVTPGQEVGTGEVIGLSGNTGRVSGKNGGYHLHFGARDAEGNRIDPTEFFKRIAPQVASGKFKPYTPERDFGTAEGRARSVEDQFQNLLRRFGPTEQEQEVNARRMARAEEMASDEYEKEQRRYDDGMLLAQIGFGVAASKSPDLMQAFGEAVTAALPGASASRKERKALKDRAIEAMGQINDKSRKENLQLFGLAVELEKEGRQQVQFERKLDLDERQVDLAERRLNAELKATGDRISFDELLAAQVMSGKITEPMAEALLLRRGGAEGGGQTVEDIRAKVQAGRTGGTAEGATAKDSDGKTIVFSNGQWVYP